MPVDDEVQRGGRQSPQNCVLKPLSLAVSDERVESNGTLAVGIGVDAKGNSSASMLFHLNMSASHFSRPGFKLPRRF